MSYRDYLLTQERALHRSVFGGAVDASSGLEEHECSPFQSWIFQQCLDDSERNASFNFSFSAYTKQAIRKQHLQHSFQAVVDRHSMLRASFRNRLSDNASQFVIHPTRVADFEEVEVVYDGSSSTLKEEIEAAVKDESNTPFDVSRGCLIRFRLFRFKDTSIDASNNSQMKLQLKNSVGLSSDNLASMLQRHDESQKSSSSSNLSAPSASTAVSSKLDVLSSLYGVERKKTPEVHTVLSLVVHQLVADEASLAIILDDLWITYLSPPSAMTFSSLLASDRNGYQVLSELGLISASPAQPSGLFENISASYSSSSSASALSQTSSTVPLPSAESDFCDYLQWSNEKVFSDVGEDVRTQWRTLLSSVPSELEIHPALSATQRRPSQAEISLAYNHCVALPSDLQSGLESLLRSAAASDPSGSPLSMQTLTLTAVQCLVSRYYQSERFVIGHRHPGRNFPELDHAVGPFSNILPLPCDVTGQPSFRALLKRTRDNAVPFFSHHDYPFSLVLEKYAKSDCFQVMFDFADDFRSGARIGGEHASFVVGQGNARAAFADVEIESIYRPEQRTHAHLYFSFFFASGHLHCNIRARKTIMDLPSLQHMMEHLLQMLKSVVENPDEKISHLPILTPSERHTLFEVWNNTYHEFQHNYRIDELVRQAAHQHPESMAVMTDAGDSVTYRQLEGRSNALASKLKEMGANGKGSVVAVILPRSVELVVSIYAVLKAGAAYLPIDPSLPPARVQYMVTDAAAQVIITNIHLAEKFCKDAEHPTPASVPAVLIDEDELSSQLSNHDSDEIALPEEDKNGENCLQSLLTTPLCVLYTSGSTGLPKGAALSHTNMANYADWHCRAYSVKHGDVCAMFAGVAFDASASEIWSSLTHGLTLHVVPDEIRAVPWNLVKWLSARDITVMFASTAIAESILAEEWPSDPCKFRVLYTGGDRLHRGPRQKLPWKLINIYGPTECTINITYAEIPMNDPLPAIGRPTSNGKVYVLDSHMQPVPIGVAGELFIGGVGVGLGYYNHPEMTQDRYIPNPFIKEHACERDDPIRQLWNQKLYRTGDLVRFRPNGQLDFIGRLDKQVKVRGFRIELGEIESCLGDHPAVKECVVLVHSLTLAGAAASAADKMLVACIVPRLQEGNKIPSADELKQFIRAKLPEYMCPQRIYLVSHLPLTANGKVDRNLLSSSEAIEQHCQVLGSSVSSFTEPRNDLERAISQIFCQVLGIDKIDINASFLENGGHSLSVMQVLSRVRHQFHVSLPASALFASPTVAQLSSLIEYQRTVLHEVDENGHDIEGQETDSDGEDSDSDNDDDGEHEHEATLVRSSKLPIDGAEFPLSANQHSMYFLAKISEDGMSSAAYNISFAIRLVSLPFSLSTDDLISRLKSCFIALCSAHTMLRTTFHQQEDGDVFQRIEPEATFQLPFKVVALPSSSSSSDLNAMLTAEAESLFDFTSSISKVALFLPSSPASPSSSLKQCPILQFTVHHIAVDLWSYVLLLEDLSNLISSTMPSASSSSPSTFTIVPAASRPQYRDFIAAQDRLMASPRGTELLTKWQKYMHAYPQKINYSLCNAGHVPTMRFRGQTLFFRIPSAHSQALQSLARHEGVTLYTVLLSAFFVLLARYSSQDDIVIGTPLAGRASKDQEEICGFFVNSVPIRADLSNDPPFTSLLKRIQASILTAIENQECPLTRIVDAVDHRDCPRHPLFQSMFVLQRAQKNSINNLGPLLMGEGGIKTNLGGIEAESVEIHRSTAQMDLILMVTELFGEDGMTASLQYNTDLFTTDAAQRISSHYQTLLESIAQECSSSSSSPLSPRPSSSSLSSLSSIQPISSLKILPDTERQRVLLDWNKTSAEFAHDCLLEEAVQKQTLQTPRSIAVMTDSGLQLTYQQLEDKASILGAWLAEQRVKDGSVVTIMLPRSPDLVISEYSVLKTGAAYLPVDPGYPAARIDFILRDAKSEFILTNQALSLHLDELRVTNPSVRIVLVDKDIPQLLLTDADSLQKAHETLSRISSSKSRDTSSKPACVLYTSGSTGNPKGAVLSHRCLMNYVSWHCRTYDIKFGDKAAMFTGVAFDASASEIWSSLTHGLTLHVVPDEVRAVPWNLVKWVCSSGVSILFASTAIAEAMIEEDAAWPQIGEPLPDNYKFRVLYTGGDRLHHGPKRPFPFRLVNIYGPTECTINITYSDVPVDDPLPAIGRPVFNGKVYILDSHMQPTPIGVAGELFIGGVGVGLGYYNHPEMTQDRYISNPFADVHVDESELQQSWNQRLYRTGDQVRWRPDGQIEFVGRLDKQVKVRGFRIELGEIETALAAHPSVKECVVVVQMKSDQSAADKQIAGFIVIRQQQAADVAAVSTLDLRKFLSLKLPEYMLPSRLYLMRSLPITQNGKVDRIQLANALEPAKQFAETLIVESDSNNASGSEADLSQLTSTISMSPIEQEVAKIFAQVLGLEKVRLADNFFDLGGHSLTVARVIARIRTAFGVELSYATLFESPTVKAISEILESSAKLVSISPSINSAGSPRFVAASASSGSSSSLLEQQPSSARIRSFGAIPTSPGAPSSPSSPARIGSFSWKKNSRLLTSSQLASPSRLSTNNRLISSPDAPSQVHLRLQPKKLSSAASAAAASSSNALRRLALEAGAQPSSSSSSVSSSLSSSFTFKPSAMAALPLSSSVSSNSDDSSSPPPEGAPLDASASPSSFKLKVSVPQPSSSVLTGMGPVSASSSFSRKRTTPSAQLSTLRPGIPGSLSRISMLSFNPSGDNQSSSYSSSPAPLPPFSSNASSPFPFGNLEALQKGNSLIFSSNSNASASLVSDLIPASTPLAFPLSEQQKSLWFLYRLQPGFTAHYHVLWAAKLPQSGVNEQVLQAAWTALVRRHPQLSARFREVDGHPAQFFLSVSSSSPLSPSEDIMLLPSEQQLSQPAPSASSGIASPSASSTSAAASIMAELKLLPEIDFLSIRFESESERQKYIEEESHRSFKLEVDCPIRCRVLSVDDGAASSLLIVGHHIVLDGWSIDILTQDLLTLYTVIASSIKNDDDLSIVGSPRILSSALTSSSLPPLQATYIDYARQQQQQMMSSSFRQMMDYWTRQLALYPTINLPAEFKRPPVVTYHGDSVLFHLEGEQYTRLAAFARAEKSTVFTTLLAVYFLQLSRYCGQNDIVIGAPVSQRLRTELEPVIGYFVNVICLRENVNESISFRRFLSSVRSTVLTALNNQEVPFPMLVERLCKVRDPSRSPLFQVMFAYRKSSFHSSSASASSPSASTALNMEPMDVHQKASPFELTLDVEDAESDGKLNIHLRYNTDLYSRSLVERMRDHFLTLVNSATQPASADLPMETLKFIPDEETEQILHKWNATQSPCPQNVCAHQLFEVQAERNPENLALVDFDTTSRLNYGQANARANQIAHQIRALNIRPGSRVGVLMQRSADMILSHLACAKAGCAFVPIDPAYPRERVKYIMQDSAVSLVLTRGISNEDRDDLFPVTSKIVNFDLLRQGHILLKQRFANLLPCTSTPNDAAYIVYTSGSTGRPKGVCVRHRNLVNAVVWHIKEYSVTQKDRTTQLVGPSFDPVILEVWPFLCSGASIHVVPECVKLSPPDLKQFIVHNGITVMVVPTPIAELLLGEEWPVDCALRVLYTGGDRLHRGKPASLPFRFDNHYGPAECTVLSTFSTLQTDEINPPIGRPLSNVQLYVLDSKQRPVPIGVPGELYIAGAGVSAGYLFRPELTAERFIRNPFASPSSSSSSASSDSSFKKRQEEALMYKTGDQVKWRPDGQLDFLGRIDNQVKIRGYRIELSEIEVVACENSQVKDCCVILDAQEDHDADKILLAFAVPRDYTAVCSSSQDASSSLPEGLSEYGLRFGSSLSDTLSQYLRSKLPEYMVPRYVLPLERLPLTANGKVDRQRLLLIARASYPSLLKIGGDDDQADPSNFEPRNDTERSVSALFSEILGRPRCPLRASFFEIGGHSLAAARLVSKLRSSLRVELPLTALFEHPSIESLSALLSGENPSATAGSAASASASSSSPSSRNPSPTKPHHSGASSASESADSSEAIQADIYLPDDLLSSSSSGAAAASSSSSSSTPVQSPRKPEPGSSASHSNRETPNGVSIPASSSSESLVHSVAASVGGSILSLFKGKPHHKKTVFLTGATGFLGGFILADYMRETTANVICLVRADSNESAYRRVKDNLKMYGLWSDEDEGDLKSRISVVCGDMDRPRLGLSDADYERVRLQADSIQHCGSMVNFILPYSRLRSANVDGTRELLRLAASGPKIKPFHYISTLSVFPSLPNSDPRSHQVYSEESLPSDPSDLMTGYSKSKWAAERLCELAWSKYHIPTYIYRPGRITGDSTTGAAATGDFLYCYIKGCIQLGMYPMDADFEVELTPVDFVSRSIVHLSERCEKHPASSALPFHLLNTSSTTACAIFRFAAQSLGYDLKPVPYSEWRNRLYDVAAEGSQENALIAFLPIFTAEFVKLRAPKFACVHTTVSLKGMSIECPASTALFHRYFEFLVKVGYLPVYPKSLEAISPVPPPIWERESLFL